VRKFTNEAAVEHLHRVVDRPGERHPGGGKLLGQQPAQRVIERGLVRAGAPEGVPRGRELLREAAERDGVVSAGPSAGASSV